jgi:Fur family peroxide stress response transcriptional regulator
MAVWLARQLASRLARSTLETGFFGGRAGTVALVIMQKLRLLDAQWRVKYSARRRDDFVQRCHERGLSVTPQRLAIIQALLASKTHPSAEDICATVRKQLPHISLATVHRILEQFCEAGEARKVTPLHESARYDGHAEPHHHVVCVQCKQIRDIEMPAADKLIEGTTSLGEFAVLGCSLEINALCRRCRTNQAAGGRTPRARRIEGKQPSRDNQVRRMKEPGHLKPSSAISTNASD